MKNNDHWLKFVDEGNTPDHNWVLRNRGSFFELQCFDEHGVLVAHERITNSLFGQVYATRLTKSNLRRASRKMTHTIYLNNILGAPVG